MGLGRTGLWPCWFSASMSCVIWGKLFTLSGVWNRTGVFFTVFFCSFVLAVVFKQQNTVSKIIFHESAICKR